MSEQTDLKSNFSALEIRIQKLIHLHEALKKSNNELFAGNKKLMIELEEERLKVQRLEEGYRNLKEMETSSTRQSISNMKKRISEIIGDIDKSISMIDENHK